MNDPEDELPDSSRQYYPQSSDRDSIQNLDDVPNPSVQSVNLPDVSDQSNC
jgi:hypothetical protein